MNKKAMKDSYAAAKADCKRVSGMLKRNSAHIKELQCTLRRLSGLSRTIKSELSRAQRNGNAKVVSRTHRELNAIQCLIRTQQGLLRITSQNQVMYNASKVRAVYKKELIEKDLLANGISLT